MDRCREECERQGNQARHENITCAGWGPVKMLKDFKEFAIRGNVMDLAVGVIIGAAFGKIVTSLVNDVVMPPIGAVGSVDFSNRFIPLTGSGTAFKTVAEAKAAGVATLNYGLFINEVINFLILS